MSNKWQRDFHHNAEYREYIQGIAKRHIAEVPVDEIHPSVFPEFEISDQTDRTAIAILRAVEDYQGEIFDPDNAYREALIDVVGEITRQASSPAQRLYDALRVATPSPMPEVEIPNFGRLLNEVAIERVLSFGTQLAEVRDTVNTASTWGEREELSPMERCHGVAHELYQQFGATAVISSDGDVVAVDPGTCYAGRYEAHFADKIKERSIRAAKELFGK